MLAAAVGAASAVVSAALAAVVGAASVIPMTIAIAAKAEPDLFTRFIFYTSWTPLLVP